MEIKGSSAVVTGGGSGIGRAIVLALAAAGGRVIAADIDEAGAEETTKLVNAAGGEATYLRVDVTRDDEVRHLLAVARERYGRVDILCNNAGIGEGRVSLFDPAEDAGHWKRTVDINLTAVIAGTRLGVQAMRAQGGGGVIVNTASMGGLRPMPTAPVYAATKAGVIHFTRSLASLKDEANIRVNAICPSFVDTPLVRQAGSGDIEQRIADVGILQPEQIAEGVLELVRDDSRAGAIMRVTVQRGIDYARDLVP